MDTHRINPSIKGSSRSLGIPHYTKECSGRLPAENFCKKFRDIFSRRGKQLARFEYRPRIRGKAERNKKKKKKTNGGGGENEGGTYLVLAGNEGGWKVNYLWKGGPVYGAGKREELKDRMVWDSRG
jgi:hypothetical protein